MSRAYQNLGLSPEASSLMVLRTAIRRLHPDTLAVRSWREARKRYYCGFLQAHAAARAATDTCRSAPPAARCSSISSASFTNAPASS